MPAEKARPKRSPVQKKRMGHILYKTIKTVDAKGRVLLGPKVAGQPVQVEESGEGEWTVRLVEAVPIKEAWLFKNPEALRRLQHGLRQAQNREFARNPREGQDDTWLADVDAENV